MCPQALNSLLNKEPASPPPKIVPQYSPALKDMPPLFMNQCIRQIIYVWTIYGNSFWMEPVDIQGEGVYAYAWNGSEWQYIRIPIDIIDSFY